MVQISDYRSFSTQCNCLIPKNKLMFHQTFNKYHTFGTTKNPIYSKIQIENTENKYKKKLR